MGMGHVSVYLAGMVQIVHLALPIFMGPNVILAIAHGMGYATVDLKGMGNVTAEKVGVVIHAHLTGRKYPQHRLLLKKVMEIIPFHFQFGQLF